MSIGTSSLALGCQSTFSRLLAAASRYLMRVVSVGIVVLSAGCNAKSDGAVAPEKRSPLVDWSGPVTLALPGSQTLRLNPIVHAQGDKPTPRKNRTVHLLSGSLDLKAPPATDRESVRRGVEIALRARLSSTFANLFFESRATNDETHLTAKVDEHRVAEVLITLRNDNVLSVRVAVSSSPDTVWDTAEASVLFSAEASRDHASPLTLTARSAELLVFATANGRDVFIVPRVRLDPAQRPRFDLATAEGTLRFTAVLVWPDVLGGERANLETQYGRQAQIHNLFLHDLADVAVSFETPEATTPITVWHNPSIREPIELVARHGDSIHARLERIARGATPRSAARLTVHARVLNSAWTLTYSEPMFPEALPVNLVLH